MRDQVIDKAIDNLPEFAVRSMDHYLAHKEIKATAKDIEPDYFPRIYQIETTSRCNLECPFCPRTIDLKQSKIRDLNEILPFEDFKNILRQMPWLKSLELFHFGEPFMHRNISEYLNFCRSSGIFTVLASNMQVATREKIDEVFDAGLGFLVMDVDSLDADTYAKARPPGRLKDLQPKVSYALERMWKMRDVETPQEAIEWKKKNHHDPYQKVGPYVIAQTIMLKDKPEYDEEEFIAWAGWPADEIRYKFLDSFRGSVVDKGTLGPDDICREAFYGFTVHANGNVVPCDRDWAGENVWGNLKTSSVSEVWRGEAANKFREQMKSTSKPKMCLNCPEGKMVNLRSQAKIQVNMFKGAEVFHE